MGVVNKNRNRDIGTQESTFSSAFTGNFAGSDIEIIKNNIFQNIKSEIFEDKFNSQCISSVSGVGSLRKKMKLILINMCRELKIWLIL